jgi:hypothetical protein
MGAANIRLTIGNAALDDHLGRLYDCTNGVTYEHVDTDGAVITLVKAGKTRCVIDVTPAALAEFIDDMDYQVEIAGEMYNGAAHRAQSRRALVRLREAHAVAEEMNR